MEQPDNTRAQRMIQSACATLVINHPFFSVILLKRRIRESKSIPTAAVSAIGNIYYNAAFIESMTQREVEFVLCHEVMHYAGGHHTRVGARDHERWNIACDMYINETLVKAGIGACPSGALRLPGAQDMTEEDIYARLPEGADASGGGTMHGDIDGFADAEDAANGETMDADEAHAMRKSAVAEAAAVAKAMGRLPGALADFAGAAIATHTPWYSILERHMSDRVQGEPSWTTPNRRYAPHYYLPSTNGEPSMGTLALVIDVSGSITTDEVRQYCGHIERIAQQCRPRAVHVLHVDTSVRHYEERTDLRDAGSEPPQVRHVGGGGTNLPKAFAFMRDKGIDPDALVVLTDGYTPFGTAPDYPVIWCVTSDVTPPYGETVRVRPE